ALAYAVVLPVLLAWPASAGAQRRDGGGGEQAVSKPSSPAPAPAPSPAPAPAPTSAPATSSGSSGDSRRGSSDRPERSGDTSRPSTGDSGDSGSARRRPGDGERVGAAVPREGGRPRGGGNPVVIIPGGYYPWGYGGLGFGGYYGGYYDPWYDPYGYGGGLGYGGGYAGNLSSRSFDDDGALRIKVKPREASVYVDGYYAGKVDDFDGLLQK